MTVAVAAGQTDACEQRPAPGTISSVLLMPQEDRVARRPLGPWAADLLELLAGARRQPTARQFCDEISRVANNGALIATLRGDPATARRLCEGQHRWQVRCARRAHDPLIAMNLLQPWINLGRLDASAGEWRAALARFEAVGAPNAGEFLAIGTLRLEWRNWATLAPTREALDRARRMVYVVDSVRALIIARRWPAVAAFAASAGLPASDPLALHLKEAVIVATGLAGAAAAAAELAATAEHVARGWSRIVFVLRRVEALAGAGQPDRARAALEPLVALAALSASARARPQTLPVLGRAASLCHELGLDRTAATLAHGALEGARAADDEVQQLECLRVLASTAAPQARGRWGDELAALQDATEYPRYRRDHHPAPASGAVRTLLAELAAIFTNPTAPDVAGAGRAAARAERRGRIAPA